MLNISKALAAHRDRITKEKGDEGFTLIELLIVVLIIGVLAAIAVPIYLTATAGAADNTAKSNVQSAVTAVGVYVTQHEGQLPPEASWATATSFPNAASNAKGYVTYVEGTNGAFCVWAIGNANAFYATNSVGVTDAGGPTAPESCTGL